MGQLESSGGEKASAGGVALGEEWTMRNRRGRTKESLRGFIDHQKAWKLYSRKKKKKRMELFLDL